MNNKEKKNLEQLKSFISNIEKRIECKDSIAHEIKILKDLNNYLIQNEKPIQKHIDSVLPEFENYQKEFDKEQQNKKRKATFKKIYSFSNDRI